ncbi:hypothetical protein JKP88DRAFT_265700 [Tribonema minus]|uniref:Uncharacterized protein n=1 Tax=Tribonema minus TaxID=303371 RepID=A0A836C8H2_9STRA|nr:hypothetical protein JKP88DRAFT_265700 [Tribonema minus]
MDEHSEASDVDEVAELTGDISTETQHRQRLRAQAQALAAALSSHPLQPVRIHGEQVSRRETIEAELVYVQGEQERVEQLLSDYRLRLQRLLRPPPAAYQCSARIRRSKQFQGVRRLLYEDAERHFAFCIGGAHSACIRYGSDSDSDSDLRVRLGFREREHARRFEDRLCAMRRGEIMDALRGAIQELQVSDIPAAALRERVRADQYDPRAAPGSPPPPPPPRWRGSDQPQWETVVDACDVSIPASSEPSSRARTESDEGGRSKYRVAIEYTSDEAGEFLKMHLKDGVREAKNDLGLPEIHTVVSVRDPQAFGAYLRRYYVQAKSKRLRL